MRAHLKTKRNLKRIRKQNPVKVRISISTFMMRRNSRRNKSSTREAADLAEPTKFQPGRSDFGASTPQWE
jgi:hypothetical protein